MLAPDEDALTDGGSDLWAQWSRSTDRASDEEEDDSASAEFGAYDGAALCAAVGGTAALDREDGGLLVYSFRPAALPGGSVNDDAMLGRLLDALRGEVAVYPARGELAWIEFVLTESVKPNMAARLNTFRLRNAFVHEPAVSGPRLLSMSMDLSGSAMFVPFDQQLDIEVVSVDYRDVAGPDDSVGTAMSDGEGL